MRVWQPGSHLMHRRDAKVEDWSWQRTAKRISTLARLAAPYKRQTILAFVALIAATLTALAPPYLAKLVIDDGIRQKDVDALTVIVALFIVAGVANLADERGADVLHGLDGRADPGRPPQHALPPPAAALARLLRAQPSRGDHQPADERRRRARPARHGRRHDSHPEHALPLRHLDHPLLPRLAARARHADGDAAHVHRDGDLPRALGPRLPGRPRAARARHRDAGRGHQRDARRPGVPA